MVSPETESKFVVAKGSEVEVTSDEEGFKGAWYRATLEETPTKSKRKKLLVRYATLVKDDGSTPLTESVDPALIRPVPPEDMAAGENFEEGDAVDAGYRDGWWTGVVRKILQCGRFMVYFDNPPDIIEFDGKDLRAHLIWIDGKWVRPEKQQSKNSMFSSGTAVEVSLGKENLLDIWVPALVIRENEDGTFYVKYKSTRNGEDSEAMKVVVDSHCTRPTPPPFSDREYDLLENVDTVHELGWREGVITKLLAGKRYTVYFKRANESKEFDHLEIRPHMDWNGSTWLAKLKESMVVSNHQMQSGHASEGADSSKQVVQVEKSPRIIQNKIEERTPSARIRKKWGDRATSFSESYAVSSAKKMKLTVSLGTLGSTKQSIPAKSSNGENAAECQASVSTDRSSKIKNETPRVQAQHSLSTPRAKGTRRRAVEPVVNDHISTECETPLSKIAARGKRQLTGELGNKIADAVTNGNLPVRSPRRITAPKEFDSPIVLGLKAIEAKETPARTHGKASSKKTPKLPRDWKDSVNTSVEEKESKEQKTERNSQKRKRGRPRKFISPELPQAVRDVSDQKAAGASNDSKARKPDKSVAEDINNLADDDQPLSTWIGGNLSSGVEELRLSSARTANGVNNCAGEKQIDIRVESPTEDTTQVLPFVKRSSIWKTIESMEVFRIVPQRPHFTPLLETKEEYREGAAIGIMVTFSGLFDKVANLQFDDPRNTFDSVMESLLDLEKHGFDVTVPQCRINELLSIKDTQRQMLDESKDVEREIMEHENVRQKCEEDMEDIIRRIRELQSQEVVMKKRKENIDKEIARLRSHAATLNQKIQNVEQEFQKTVTAPWK